MTLSQDDLQYLKWSLLTLLTVLTLGGSAVFFSQQYAHNSRLAKHNAQQQLSDARNKLNAARDDQKNMSEYTKEYSAINRRGIIGEEQRLNLIEDLDTLRKYKRVLDFKYSIAPQQAYTSAAAQDSGNFDLKYSPMKIELELLHEGQLIGFFDSLRRDTKGWFILEKCVLERSTGTGSQLKADCAGGWLTIRNRNAK